MDDYENKFKHGNVDIFLLIIIIIICVRESAFKIRICRWWWRSRSRWWWWGLAGLDHREDNLISAKNVTDEMRSLLAFLFFILTPIYSIPYTPISTPYAKTDIFTLIYYVHTRISNYLNRIKSHSSYIFVLHKT